MSAFFLCSVVLTLIIIVKKHLAEDSNGKKTRQKRDKVDKRFHNRAEKPDHGLASEEYIRRSVPNFVQVVKQC